MGYMRHEAIIVSGCYGNWIDLAHEQAFKAVMRPSPIVESHINGYRSFFCPPDGSKFGWPEDIEGNQRRERFIEWLNSHRYEDDSSPLQWVEVQYADDEKETIVTNHSDIKTLPDVPRKELPADGQSPPPSPGR